MNDYYRNLKCVYNKNYDTFCYQNCLMHLLGGLGIENAEYYINKSMSLIVHKEDDYNLRLEFGKYFRGLLPDYDDKVTRFFPDDDYMYVFKENIKYVNNNDPIIVGVDSYHLSYLPYYHVSHGNHAIILTGYDKVNSKVEIVDWMEPWFFRGYISVEEFLNARNSMNESDGGMFSGNPIKNNWAKLTDKEGWDASLSDIINYTIKLSLNQYYFPEDHEKEYYGIKALEYINEKIKCLEEQSFEIQTMYLDDLHKGFFMINRRREFWRGFLDTLHVCDEYANLDDIIIKLDDVIDLCEKWLYRLIKYRLRKKNGYSLELSNGLKYMIDLEKELGDMMLVLKEGYHII